MTGLTIRAAKAADCAALAGLIAPLGYEGTAEDFVVRLGAMNRETEQVLVADLDCGVVGCLTTSAMRTLHRPAPVGRISLMVVEESHRGKGIGSALVAAAELRMRQAGCYIAEVTSRMDRERAHRFYERLGYARTSVRLAREL